MAEVASRRGAVGDPSRVAVGGGSAVGVVFRDGACCLLMKCAMLRPILRVLGSMVLGSIANQFRPKGVLKVGMLGQRSGWASEGWRQRCEACGDKVT